MVLKGLEVIPYSSLDPKPADDVVDGQRGWVESTFMEGLGLLNPVLDYLFSGVVKHTFEKELSKSVGVPVTLDSVDVKVNRLVLHNLRAEQPDGFESEEPMLSAPRIAIDYSLYNLLVGETVNLRKVQVESPTLKIVRLGILVGNSSVGRAVETATKALLPKKQRAVTVGVTDVRDLQVKVEGPWLTAEYPKRSFRIENLGSETFRNADGLLDFIRDNLPSALTYFLIDE